jgi:hypothetical protein
LPLLAHKCLNLAEAAESDLRSNVGYRELTGVIVLNVSSSGFDPYARLAFTESRIGEFGISVR